MIAKAEYYINGIYYKINDNNRAEVIAGSIKYSGVVDIPQSITANGRSNTVVSIGNSAFENCPNLTSITIPNSVTKIGDSAFRGCIGIDSIAIPWSVTNIGSLALSGCTGLEKIVVARGNSIYDSRDDCNAIITKDSNMLIAGCKNTTITNSVACIGNGAFYGCSNLTNVTIPESVVSIDNFAFYGCTSLISVTIPSSVINIGGGAFSGCSGLEEIFVKQGNSIYESRNDGKAIIEKKSNTLIIGLKNTTIPNDVTSIGDYAFLDCIGLNFIEFPNIMTSIGKSAFQGCSNLSDITIPEGLISIDSSAFQGCNSLTNITIPESVISIGSSAFCDCGSLAIVSLNSNIVVAASRLSSTSMASIFGNQVIKYIIGDAVKSIGKSAFQNSISLTSINIPRDVTSIGDGAFYNCPRLRHIYVSSQTPADCIGPKTFYCTTDYARNNYEVYDYAILHVPMGTKEEYAAAYEWRYFAKIKEDLDINGQVFYTTLSVNQAGTGYVKHYVKADEPYTLYIGSEEGMRINTVLYNGEDVTDMLVDGYYTTPNITRPSKIVVSFEQDPDGVANIPAENNLHIYGNDGSLFVSGIVAPQQMSVYTMNGMLINSQTLEGDARIKMSEGTYIVKIGKRTFKVLM